MKKLLTFLTLSTLLIAAPNSFIGAEKDTETKATAETKPAGDAAAKAAAPKPLPFQGTVDTIDAAAGQFTVKRKNGKVHTFIVTPETVITKNEAPAKLTDLTAGEAVRGTRLKNGDKSQLLKLMIGQKPASDKDAGGKAKKEAAADKEM